MSSERPKSNCRHCAEPIEFGMYWVGGTPAAPRPVWYHPPGNQTCLRKPAGWKGVGGWPMAEPVDQDFEDALEQVIAEHAEALQRLANQ